MVAQTVCAAPAKQELLRYQENSFLIVAQLDLKTRRTDWIVLRTHTGDTRLQNEYLAFGSFSDISRDDSLLWANFSVSLASDFAAAIIPPTFHISRPIYR